MQPSGEPDELELRDYLAVLRRRKWVVVAATVAVTAVALAVSLLQTPVYRGTADVLLRPRASEQIFAPADQQTPAQLAALVETEIRVMESRSVRDAVEAEVGQEVEPSIEARGETEVVGISVESTDPDAAAEMANTYARVYVETRRQAQIDDLLAAAEEVQKKVEQIQTELTALEQPIADLDARIRATPSEEERAALQAQRDDLAEQTATPRRSLQNRLAAYTDQLDRLQVASELTATGGAQIISEAAVPDAPVKPLLERNVALAAALGLMLGIGLAFLRDHLDDSIRSTDDFERTAPGITVLGVVPHFGEWKRHDEAVLASVTSPHSPTAEAHRTLRTSVQFVGLDRPVKMVQATSPGSEDGKTATIANLAVQLARTGRRVVLVDCDLRRPRLHEFFGAHNMIGFTSVLLGEATLANALVAVSADHNLVLLPSGPPPPNPSELLSVKRAGDILRQLAEGADFVLIDSPPVLPVTDALVLARVVDAMVVVVRSRMTSRRNTHRTFELLAQVDAPVIGAVLNDLDAAGGYPGYGTYVYAPDRTRSRSWVRRALRNGARADGKETVTAVRR